MIAAMFEQYVKKRNARTREREHMRDNIFDNGYSICVDSAGIMQHARPIAQHTCTVLTAHDIAFDSAYISKFCDKQLFDKADYIFTMGAEQTEFLEKAYGICDKIIPLSRFNGGEDIPDPYGMGEQAYAQVYDIFERIPAKIYAFVCRNNNNRSSLKNS